MRVRRKRRRKGSEREKREMWIGRIKRGREE